MNNNQHTSMPPEKTASTLYKNCANNDERKTTFKLPELAGDTQLYVGQIIVTLFRLALENNTVYSNELIHDFKVELMSSILDELSIAPEEIIVLRQKLIEDLNDQ